MDCKTCKELRAGMCNNTEKSASISVNKHEACMARLERTIRRLFIILSLSGIANILLICAVIYNG